MNAPLPEPEKPRFIQEAPPAHGVAARRSWRGLEPSEIRQIRASEAPGGHIAKQFGISESTVSRIRANLLYRDESIPEKPRRSESSIRFDSRTERWRIRVQRVGSRRWIGAYLTKEEALAAEPRIEAWMPSDDLSYEMRAWIQRRKREMNGEPLTPADREQLRRHLEDL